MSNQTENTALLIMDVQQGILARLGDAAESFIAANKKAVDFAHDHNIQVIFIVVGFRPGIPEVSPNNKMFNNIKSGEMGKTMINPQPVITPTEQDIVVTKRRVSAFSGSDLAVILSAHNIKHLILTGVATSGVVLSTTRQAADLDFQITILSDLCNDADPEVHKVLLEKVFPRQAEVITSEEWMNRPK